MSVSETLVALVGSISSIATIYMWLTRTTGAPEGWGWLKFVFMAIGVLVCVTFLAGVIYAVAGGSSSKEAKADDSMAPQRGKKQRDSTSLDDANTASVWLEHLNDDACDEPCCGGNACSPKRKFCASGIRCLPGSCTTSIEEPLRWTLHLNAIKKDGKLLECGSQPDLSLCIKVDHLQDWSCVSTEDACSNSGSGVPRSRKGIPLTTADLHRPGVAIEVRQGSETVVASREGTYSDDSVMRSMLCTGGYMGLESSLGFSGFMFFLEPD